MSEFCSCGSLIIEDRCTNKNCSARKSTAASMMPGKAKSKTNKAAGRKKSSRCITYNLYDLED